MKKIIFSFIILLSVINVKASNYYWVGGSGNWSDYGTHWATASGGLIFHVQTPGPNDNVFFDANSFTAANQFVTLDTTQATCKNMNWNGVINNPVLNSSTLNKAVNIYGSLRLSNNMSIDLQVSFNMQSSGTENIRSSGASIPGISFKGTGNWYLQDNLSVKAFSLANGSVYTNGFALATDYIDITSPDTFDITGSTVSCVYDFKIEIFADPVIVSAGSTINAANLTCEYIGGTGKTFYDVNVTGQILTTGAGSVFNFHDVTASTIPESNGVYHNVTVKQNFGGTANKVMFTAPNVTLLPSEIDTLQFGPLVNNILLYGSTTINNLFEINGNCSDWIKMYSTNGATLTKSSGTVTLNYVLLENIIAMGGATFIANNSIDLGGNSGWTINSSASQNLYWVGGSGNWEDVNHWSATSGGSGGTCIPGASDNVFFDANSFLTNGDSVTINSISFCKNITWTGVTHNPVLRSAGMLASLNIYGSFTLNSNMIVRPSVILNFQTSSIATITTSGVAIPAVYFNGTGKFYLQDNLTAAVINQLKGAVFTQGHTINTSDFFISSIDTVNITGSQINCSGNFEIMSSGNPVVMSSGSTINALNLISMNPATSDKTFNNVNVTGDVNFFDHSINHFNDITAHSVVVENSVCHNVTVELSFIGTAHKVLYTGSNAIMNTGSIDSLQFGPLVNAVTLSGTLIINNDIELNGSCSHWIKLNGNGSSTLSKTSGTLNLSYILMKDITATGGATCTANNSVDLGGNSGWTINSSAPKNLYWVGGNGNWNDVNHWSLSSGSAGGSCIPGPDDNVFFDANSFTSATDTVIINNTAFCKDLNGSAAIHNLIFPDYTSEINVFGSLLLNNKVTIIPDIIMSSAGSDSINLSGGILNTIGFSGTGKYFLNDDLNVSDIKINKGSFYTQGHTVNTQYFRINKGDTLDISGSEINCTYDFTFGDEGDVAIVATGSTINASDLINNNTTISGKTFNDVNVTAALTVYGSTGNNIFNNVSANFISATNGVFHNVIVTELFNGHNAHKVTFTGTNCFLYESTIDTLQLLNAGNHIYFDGTITVNDFIYTNASSGFPVSINGSTSAATILNVPSGSVCLDYIVLKDVQTSGAATFNAGDHSIDLGNNTGWSFTSCIPVLTDVWPGDANGDNVADNLDILNIGVAYGNTGTTRTGANTSWTAQPALTWSTQFLNGTNLNNADCDGNGIVNELDTNVVILNYGQTHLRPLNTNAITSGFPMYFDLPIGVLQPGSTVTIPIKLGDMQNPVSELYGMAFTIDYNTSVVAAGTIGINYINSWLVPSGNYIHIEKDFPVDGKLDVAVSRTDHQNISGNGTIATLTFKVANNASGNLQLGIENIKAISDNEVEIPVMFSPGNVATGVNDHNAVSSISFYPNPVDDIIHFASADKKNKNIIIYDYTGKEVISEKNISESLFVGNLSSGVYLVKIADDKGSEIYCKKILKK